MRTIIFFCALQFSASTFAELYAYVNENGDYVVSQKRPKEPVEYSVLTDDGDFIRLVPAPQTNVPITHWRPWFLPKEPDPLDGPRPNWEEREPHVDIEEVEDDAEPAENASP